MGSEGWDTVAIESLIEDGTIVAHKDGNYGSSYPRVHEFGAEGVPFLTAKLLDDSGHIDFERAPRLSTDKADRLPFGFIESGDVLLSHNATVGRVAVVPELSERVLVGTSLTYFRLDRDRLLPRYLAAYFSGKGFQNQLKAAMSHSTRNQVPITAQRKLSVVVPPLHEQRKIIEHVCGIQDKIELNRRMNRTLEALARAIFKSWFVDFDPVHAKAEGREPVGMAPETAALFPDSFQDSPLGKIPEGWEVGYLEEHMEFALGGDWGKDTPDDECTQPAYCIRGTDLPALQAGQVPELRLRYLKPSSFEKRSLQPFDIVFEVSGGSPTQSTGRSLLVHELLIDAYGLPVVCTNFCRLARFSSEEFALFASYLLRHLYSIGEFFAHETGTTTIKNFAFKRFTEGYAVALPDGQVLAAFAEVIAPLLAMRAEIGIESSSLSATREVLLPRLISGELKGGA